MLASCTLEDSVGNFSIDLGASFNNDGASCSSSQSPRRESISSISFDASYASVFGDKSKSGSSNSNSTLCHSRWESLGDSNSNIVCLGAAAEGAISSGKPPSFISRGPAGAPAPLQRAAMAIKMPRRQFSSHIRTTLHRVSCSTTSSALSFGESTTLDQKSNDATEEQQQQQQQQQQNQQPQRNLPPRPSMTKFKEDISRRRLLTRAASEKSVLLGAGRATASNHTFATYSSGQPSNHTFAIMSKESLSSGSKNTFPHASNHTFASFASFASSNHTGILSTWESVEEQSSLEDSTIASFSSATVMSFISKQSNNNNNNIALSPLSCPPRQQQLRRHSTGDASSCRRLIRIHSGISRDNVIIQHQAQQQEQEQY